MTPIPNYYTTKDTTLCTAAAAAESRTWSDYDISGIRKMRIKTNYIKQINVCSVFGNFGRLIMEHPLHVTCASNVE